MESKPKYIPHFSNPTDQEWLGIGDKMGEKNLILGLKSKKGKHTSADVSGNFLTGIKKAEIVYFESLDDASGLSAARGIHVDVDRKKSDAEDQLLLALVQYPPARHAMRSMGDAAASGGPASSIIKWSDLDREWLFRSLIGDEDNRDPIPPELQDGGTAGQLREYLLSLDDVPEGAFALPETGDGSGGTAGARSPPVEFLDADAAAPSDKNLPSLPDVEEHYLPGLSKYGVPISVETKDTSYVEGRQRNNENASYGSLDKFFVVSENIYDIAAKASSIDREMRSHLTVQEALATIFKCTETKRRDVLLDTWERARTELLRRSADDEADGGSPGADETDGGSEEGLGGEFQSTTTEELRGLVSRLASDVGDAIESVVRTEESYRKISSRIIDHASRGSGVREYEISDAEQETLFGLLDEFEAELDAAPDDDPAAGGEEEYVFGTDQVVTGGVDPAYGSVRREVSFGEEKRDSNGLMDNSEITRLMDDHYTDLAEDPPEAVVAPHEEEKYDYSSATILGEGPNDDVAVSSDFEDAFAVSSDFEDAFAVRPEFEDAFAVRPEFEDIFVPQPEEY